MLLFVRSDRLQRFSWISLLILISQFSNSEGCRVDQFACHDGTECIRQSYRCNGDEECDDGSDEIDCEKPFVDNYLLVSVARPNSEALHVRPQIYQIDLETGHSKPFLRTDPTLPGALAIDAKKQVLYYVDRGIAMIGSVPLAHENSSMRVIYRDPSLTVDLEGLAVDTATEKLYFSDGGSDPKIVEIDLLDRDREQRIIVSGRNLKPRALVIDEANSELYWTDWGSKPGIFVVKLELNARPQTLIADNIVMPNALAIDFKEEVMYWVDAHLDRIEMSNLYGQDRRTVVRETGDVHHYGITLSREFLYVADWSRSTVLRVDRKTNRTAPQQPTLSGLKTAIAYYNSNFTNVGRTRPTVAPQGTSLPTSDGITRPSVRVDPEGITLSTSNGRRRLTVDPERMTLYTSNGRRRLTVDPEGITLYTTKEKPETEKLVSGYGSDVVIVLAAGVFILLLLLITVPLAIWCGKRRRRRAVAAGMTFGYSPATAFDDGHSSRGRLLIEDTYAIKANSYEHLPEVGMPPSPPKMRPEPTGCGTDDDWYSKLADDPGPGYCVIKKPTEYDYYDDTNVL